MPVKAFQLVPVIEQIQISDKVRAQITSFERCDTSLYIGTADSFLVEFTISEQLSQEKKFNCSQKQYKYLGHKKPISTLKVIGVLERLLCICDSNLLFFDTNALEQIDYSIKLRHVNAFCINENSPDNSPFTVQICVSKRKSLLIFNVSADRLEVVREVSLSQPGLIVAINRSVVCVGTGSQFMLINWETNEVNDLCNADDIAKPFVLRTGDEFLISGPSSLGLFVNLSGSSERAPICFKHSVNGISFFHPSYVIALSSNSVNVYSVSDQSLKQEIPLNNPNIVSNFDGTIFVSTRESIYTLESIPWETQIQLLLAEKDVNTALEVLSLQNWHKTGQSRDGFKATIDHIQQQAGFIELLAGNYSEAKHLFIEGHLHVRELLCLFPFLTPSVFTYIPISPSLHEIAVSFEELCKDNAELYRSLMTFAADYLEEVKVCFSKEYERYKLIIDASLVLLYSRLPGSDNADKLIALVSDPVSELFKCKIVITALEKQEQWNALALYHFVQTSSSKEKGFEIWRKLESGQLIDEYYPGLNFIIKLMSEMDDVELLLRNVDFVLEKDQHQAVTIFTNRTTDDKNVLGWLSPDSIIEHLQRYPEALRKYIEFLVYDLQSDKESYHTHLASIYLNDVIQLKANSSEEMKNKRIYEEACERLQNMLEFSNKYRTHLILNAALDAKLHKESAILYGKLGEHEKALSILVYQLNDFKAAEKYCNQKEQEDRLFHSLLGIYLNPKLSESERQTYQAPALALLNTSTLCFDMVRVLHLIPTEWSCTSLERFMVKGLRKAQHHRFDTALQRALTYYENQQTKVRQVETKARRLFVSEQSHCSVCRIELTETDYVWLPFKSLLVHRHCLHKNINICNQVK